MFIEYLYFVPYNQFLGAYFLAAIAECLLQILRTITLNKNYIAFVRIQYRMHLTTQNTCNQYSRSSSEYILYSRGTRQFKVTHFNGNTLKRSFLNILTLLCYKKFPFVTFYWVKLLIFELL
jgi:hypothetical protein